MSWESWSRNVGGCLGVSRSRALVAVVAVAAAAVVVIAWSPGVAVAAVGFPNSGWGNPVAPATFEDWHFASCDGYYLSGKAHLGADSQGTHAGQAVVALGAGTVARIVAANWGPGGAVGVEHQAGDGSRFLAVYGHINVGVSVGQHVSPGQAIGTLYDQGSNSHLHLGVRPLGAGESAGSITLWGNSTCSGGSAPTFGFVNPLPWLSAHGPGSNALAEGAFVRTPSDGAIYRVAGGAVIHVDSCGPLNGCQPLTQVSSVAGVSRVPRDGTFLRVQDGPSEGLIARVIGGHLFGLGVCVDGCGGLIGLDSGGFFDYDRAHPTVGDGSFVRVATGSKNGLISRAVGGHLFGLATCVDGCAGAVNVDETAFDNYDRAHPTVGDGSFVRVATGSKNGLISRAAGGALLPLSSCEPLNACAGLVQVDETAFDSYASAHRLPADGTVLRGLPSGALWTIQSGKRAPAGGSAGAVAVNDWTVGGFPLMPCPAGYLGAPPNCTAPVPPRSAVSPSKSSSTTTKTTQSTTYTGRRARARKKCKRIRNHRKRTRCVRRANRLPR